jgi:hypothetical protein
MPTSISVDARRVDVLRDGLTAVGEWEADHSALTDDEMEAARRRVAEESAERSGRD